MLIFYKRILFITYPLRLELESEDCPCWMLDSRLNAAEAWTISSKKYFQVKMKKKTPRAQQIYWKELYVDLILSDPPF